MKPHLAVLTAALRVLAPPLFAVRHVEALIQVARGRARAAQASRTLADRAAADKDRALRYLTGRART